MAMIKIQGNAKFTGKTIFDAGPSAASTAAAYIAAVEAADGQTLEEGVKTAYTNFITDLWSDGIWSALKASCIMAGARTLNGALVPLIGTAPTNNNFVSGDYNRETGLVGDGTTKYLNSNRQEDDEPQNSKHVSVYINQSGNSANQAFIGGLNASPLVGSQIYSEQVGQSGYFRCNGASSVSLGVGSSYALQTGLIAVNRANSSQISYRLAGSTSTVSNSSAAGYGVDIHVFKRNSTAPIPTSPTTARLSFYSIGESVDLALLDTRVSTLMSDIAAAI